MKNNSRKLKPNQTTCIFIEDYAVGREHAGLRRLSGAWTTAMIRGSASVIMFTYSSLLVTMCRNIITKLRETFLHRFIPFDSAVAFHKYIAIIALLATSEHPRMEYIFTILLFLFLDSNEK